jgi:histidyl-tRNA synthetase
MKENKIVDKKTIQSLRGMNDIVDDDTVLFDYFIKNASNIAVKYGFDYIQTPILEQTSLFKRTVGNSSDIVNKEMYQFLDKGSNDVCLRPEGTAGVVRSFIENKFDRIGNTKRYFYYGPMFRYERPQKGRLRQFHQFGSEVFNSNSMYEDANIILLIKDILDSFDIKFTLQLNSLGSKTCMNEYKKKLVLFLENIKTKLCSDCNNRIYTNPMRVLDCKVDTCKSLLANSPKIIDNLSKSCDDDFQQLKSILDFNNIQYIINKNLVRGLDYYNKTAFEFISDEIGAQNTIAAGGRYDNLVESLGGISTSAIGFAIGVERLLPLLKIKYRQKDLIYFGSMCDDALNLVFQKANEKRKDNIVYIEYISRSFNKHFKLAMKQNATTIALIGESELENSTIWIKNIKSNEEKIIKYGDF